TCISYLKKQNRVKVVNKFLGHGGYSLTELKSIAADPKVIPLGSAVYIPQAENVVVDGKRLNGIFYVHDIGSAIDGKHIDIFIGKKSNITAFASAGMKSSGSVDVYILE
ncbi:MAG: 3D domain-containing protein, partial [bacterium]